LDPQIQDLIPEEDRGSVQPGVGLPYEMEDLAKVIKEQLPAWEVDIEEEDGLKHLRIVCAKHFISKDLHSLVEEFKAARDENLTLRGDRLHHDLLGLYKEHGYVKLRQALESIHKNISDLL
jgi:hypothetical protein